MKEDLYHPRHVVRALDSVEGMTTDELRAAIAVTDRGAAGYLPEEALVRLIRRARTDSDPVVEHYAVSALAKRVSAWAWRKYSGLNPEGREDVAQTVLQVIAKSIACQTGIDFWEITFARNRDRAGADAYQEHFAQNFDVEHIEFDATAHESSDEGHQANEVADEVLFKIFAAKALTREEMTYFHGLFLSNIPLSSPKASLDLVRMFGKPEGTLREIKTAIKEKLKVAWEDNSK